MRITCMFHCITVWPQLRQSGRTVFAAQQPVQPEYLSCGPAMMQIYMHMFYMSHGQKRPGCLLPHWNVILEAE